MDEDQISAGGSMDRLERKIDTLTTGVGEMNTRLGSVETRLGGVETRLGGVETRLGGVETRLGSVEGELRDVSMQLTGVETRLSGVEKELTEVHILAGETNTFSKNVWDSLTSLSRNMDEGFKEAKKDREEGVDLVHKAIRKWGERVHALETGPTRTTKRRP